MATGFSVSVNIGGKVLPSLAGAVGSAKTQVKGLEATLANVGARINAPFQAVNRHLAATSKHMAAMQRAGRNATLLGTAPAAWFGAKMIKDASEFAKARNMVEALGEATPEQSHSLGRLAQDLAGRFDAGGATGILKSATELMKAGFTYDQARGALEQVLSASALAGDMTPADVGASLSKTLTQFHMPMKTYENAVKSSTVVTDRMVYAAVSTVASMKDISESFKFAGGVAATTGSSLDAVTASVMAFAKSGVLGSDAGVALRSAIVRLVKMPKGGMKALSRIGMNLGDYTQARPVTADGIITNLKGDGLDASGARSQIASILKNRGRKDQATVSAEITKAVQGAIGSSSAVDANQIAESVNDAVTAAGSKVDFTKFMTDLKAKFDAGIATTGDIAQILEARHISRYMALLKTDLPALIKEIQDKSDGYSQKQYKIANQGLPAVLLKLGASWEKLRISIVESVGEDIADAFTRVSSAMQNLSATAPALMKTGVYFALAAAAAGPLLFVLGAVGRVGLLAMRGLNLAVIGMLMPIRLVAGLLAGAFVAGIARLSAMAIGLRMLTALGAGATLSALGGSLLTLGRSILMFPVVALRAIGAAMWGLVANPVGLIIGGLLAALTALGVWVYNNWSGILQFFSSFGEGFMAELGKSGESLKPLIDGLSSAAKWLGDLLGPIDESGSKWKSWGETMGGIVASGVNLVISGIEKLIGFLGSVVSGAQAVGSALSGMFSFKAWGGAAAAPAASVPLAGARALGGPVSWGKPYLVGERGPELFVPGMSGRIETNDALRRLQSDGVAAVAATESRMVQGGTYTITNHWEISGVTDSRAVADQIDSRFAMLMRQLEADQRGLLSD